MSEISEAYEYLMGVPDGEFNTKVRYAWNRPITTAGGRLFTYCTPNVFKGCGYGCLTQVRLEESCKAYTQNLTEKIRADDRIPTGPQGITKDNLHVFAEWQERMEHYFMGLESA